MVGFQIPPKTPDPASAAAPPAKGKAAGLYRLVESTIAYNAKPVIEKRPDGSVAENHYLDNGSGTSYLACTQVMSADQANVHQIFFEKNGKKDGVERKLRRVLETDVAGADKSMVGKWVVLEETQWAAGVKNNNAYRNRVHPYSGKQVPEYEASYINDQVQEEKIWD